MVRFVAFRCVPPAAIYRNDRHTNSRLALLVCMAPIMPTTATHSTARNRPVCMHRICRFEDDTEFNARCDTVANAAAKLVQKSQKAASKKKGAAGGAGWKTAR